MNQIIIINKSPSIALVKHFSTSSCSFFFLSVLLLLTKRKLRRCMFFCCSIVSNSLQPPGLQPIRLLCPWDFPGKNTRVSCHFILQGIFPTQRLNPCLLCLLHCKQILYLLSHRGSQKINFKGYFYQLAATVNNQPQI